MVATPITPIPTVVTLTSKKRDSALLVLVCLVERRVPDTVHLLCQVETKRHGHTSKMCFRQSPQRVTASHAVNGLAMVFSTIYISKATLTIYIEGSGHYVKMVHNGIEYGDMQLITEVCAF